MDILIISWLEKRVEGSIARYKTTARGRLRLVTCESWR
jgi:hypothetical protein